MTDREPTRIVEEGPSEMGSLLAGLSTTDLAPDFDVAAAVDRFDASLQPPAAPPTSGGMGPGMKLVAAAFVFGLVGVGVWAIRTNRSRPEPETHPEARVEAGVDAPQEPVTIEPEVGGAPPAALEEPATPPEPAEVPRAEPAVEPVDSPSKPEPTPSQRPDPEPVPDEITLAADMKKAFADNPRRALKLARQGEKLYPDGMFARERQAYIALSLQALGQTKKAEAAAEAFLKAHPKGVLADRLRRDVLGE